MKTTFALLLALQLSLGSLFALPQAPTPAGTQANPDDAEVRKLNAAETQAFLDKDPKAMEIGRAHV